MRFVLAAIAFAALVSIGTAEALVSVEQLAQLPSRGRPLLSTSGVALTFAGLALSSAVYAVLGWLVGLSGVREGSAARVGALTGISAGLVGGFIRAVLVRDYLVRIVEGFRLPVDLVWWSLGVFVFLSVLASGAGGAALTWLGFRLARPLRRPRR